MDLSELFQVAGSVEALELDDTLADHLRQRGTYEKHRVRLAEVIQVLARAPCFFENVGAARTAPVIMVGPTDSGRMLVIPIEPTSHHGVWRPVTAFEANSHHIKRYTEEDGNGQSRN